jgi:hypothetical protein
MDPVERLGRRLDAVRGVRNTTHSEWAHNYWALVETQLMRRLNELNRGMKHA